MRHTHPHILPSTTSSTKAAIMPHEPHCFTHPHTAATTTTPQRLSAAGYVSSQCTYHTIHPHTSCPTACTQNCTCKKLAGTDPGSTSLATSQHTGVRCVPTPAAPRTRMHPTTLPSLHMHTQGYRLSHSLHTRCACRAWGTCTSPGHPNTRLKKKNTRHIHTTKMTPTSHMAHPALPQSTPCHPHQLPFCTWRLTAAHHCACNSPLHSPQTTIKP